ncbi:MAG: hypothetical protein PHI29_12410 [Gallionella sp.]|nr:hypothetical protein [Gallionella sp.]
MKKNLYTLIAILLPLTTMACSQPPTQKAMPVATVTAQTAPVFMGAAQQGYIVTAKDEASIRSTFAKQGVTMLRSIGNGQFEMHLQQDPGLSVVSEIASRSGGNISAVQANQRYQAF